MKTWQIASIVFATIIVTALVTASAFVLLNPPKDPLVYPYGYYPNPTTNPQITPTPAPITTPTPQTTTSPKPITSAAPTQPPNLNQTNTPGTPINPLVNTITINNASARAQNYLYQTGNPDLTLGRIRDFTQNFYIQIYERSTGIGAFEIIVDKNTGGAYIENGPTLTWNTKYALGANGIMTYRNQINQPGSGIMEGIFGEGGPMNGFFGGTPNVNTLMTVTPYQAQANAQLYLNSYYPGTTAGIVTSFYGYYTIEVLLQNSVYGLISVNGFTGQVWYHNWHGAFVQ